VSPVKYELGFHIPEDDILHSDSREALNSLILILLNIDYVFVPVSYKGILPVCRLKCVNPCYLPTSALYKH
jgi:hypothetical protein